MKRIVALFLLCMGVALFAQSSDDNKRQALKGALDNAKPSLASAPFGKGTVAVLPIRGEQGYKATQYLKTLLTQAGFTCVEGKEDPAVQEILKEMAWDARKDDILNPATVVSLGKLMGAQYLVYGTVMELNVNPERVFAELSLHADRVATKEHVWGGVFISRFYVAADVKGLVTLDPEFRELLKAGFDEATASLKAPEYASRLAAVKNATVIPLSGDIDQYMTGLLIEGLTRTSVTPRNPSIPSLAYIRSIVRDGKLDTSAILYGAIRDLSEKKGEETKDLQNMKKNSSITMRAEIQLYLEDPRTGDILWSKTISKQKVRESQKDIHELDEKDLKRLGIMNGPKLVLWLICLIGGLLVLFLVYKFIKTAFICSRMR